MVALSEAILILRKRGETHSQFIDRLQKQNTILQNNMNQVIDDLERNNLVPFSRLKTALDKVQELRNLLQRYNLWQGE